MKTRTLILSSMLSVMVVALTFCGRKPSRSQDHLSSLHTKKNTSAPSESIAAKIKNRSYENADEARERIEALLTKWQPVGLSVEEFKVVLGEPDRESNEMLTYKFDNGFHGAEYRFGLKDGKVTSFERVGLD